MLTPLIMKPQALFVAQPTYTAKIDQKKIWDDLPRAAEEAGKLAAALASHGYEMGGQDLLDGGETADIAKTLDEWFANVANGSCLIFFWTGHGCSDGGKHYLVCRNSPKVGISSFNAIDTGSIGVVLANCRAEKILVVLDTCYSGLGAGEMVESVGRILSTRAQVVGQQRAFAIIASAHPLEEAKEGILLRAFRTALLDPNVPRNKRRWTDYDQFIHSAALSKASRLLMTDDVSSAQYVAHGDDQEFIPNPRYQTDLPEENVEERLGKHFNLAARGIEVGETGWFFSGRKQLLGRLVDWLNTAEDGVRIVTGPPGAGKSAVMGRLATLQHARYRQKAIDAGVVKEGEDVIPPVGAIDVAVHTKGKTLDDCARALAKGLGVEINQDVSVDLEQLVAELGKLNRKITLMVDALDEAAGGQGTTIASRLIVPLASLPRVRVLVGTRRSLDGAVIPEGEDRHGRLRAAFGANAIIDDLEDEPETQDDIAAYVRLRLESSAKRRNDAAGNLGDVARRVATQASGIFLYARIVSRTLQDRDRLDGELPATALEAFEQDLSVRFEGNVRRVDDLLSTLAWGEGKGLTRRVWPLIANALAVRERLYDDDDIAWVLSHAGWHIIEAGEDGQAVYRLAHQALADHYRGKFDEKEAQVRIVATLTHGIVGASWLDCDHYLWRHLADHAAKAGRLDELVRDPGFLAVADAAHLVIALPSVESAESRRFVDIYDRVVDRLVDVKPVERLPLIHMTAQMEDSGLARALEPPVATHWRCEWARTRSIRPHRIIGKHTGLVTSVTFGAIDGRPVVISGSDDVTVRLWDARTGEPIGAPLGGIDLITSVAFGSIDGSPVVISAGRDKTIRLWDLRTGDTIGAPLKGHNVTVTSVAFGLIDGGPVVVSASGDKTIRLWDVRTGEPIGAPLKRHSDLVTSVALGVIDGRPVVVSGSRDKTIGLWDARTGEPIGAPLRGHTNWVSSVAFGAIDGQPFVVSGSSDMTVRLWDARTSKPIGAPFGGTDLVTSVAFGVIDGRLVIASGSYDKTIRLWDTRTSKPIGAPFEGTELVTSVAFGVIDGHPVIAAGSEDKTIQLSDARTGEPIGAPLEGHADFVTSVAFGMIGSLSVVGSGSRDKTIRLWDARTGEPIGAPFEGHTDFVTSVAFGMIEGGPVVVSGSSDETIRLWDARTGEPIGAPFEGHTDWVTTVAFGEIEGGPVVASGSYDKTIRLWDAMTGEPIGAPLRGHTNWVSSVAFGAIDGRPIVASGSSDESIRLWDARTGEPLGVPFEGHTDWVNSVAFGSIDGRPMVASGSDDGTIRLWGAMTGENGHSSAITIGEPIQAVNTDSGAIVIGLARGIVLLKLFATPQK